MEKMGWIATMNELLPTHQVATGQETPNQYHHLRDERHMKKPNELEDQNVYYHGVGNNESMKDAPHAPSIEHLRNKSHFSTIQHFSTDGHRFQNEAMAQDSFACMQDAHKGLHHNAINALHEKHFGSHLNSNTPTRHLAGNSLKGGGKYEGHSG